VNGYHLEDYQEELTALMVEKLQHHPKAGLVAV
jgi:hypothetical protein